MDAAERNAARAVFGFSHARVPPLSKVAAMRSAGGTAPGPEVTLIRKSTMANLPAPSRQEGNADTIACASITAPTNNRPSDSTQFVTP
jgi:hypothetical protein